MDCKNFHDCQKYFELFLTKDQKILTKDFKNYDEFEITMKKFLKFLLSDKIFNQLIKNIYENFDNKEKF